MDSSPRHWSAPVSAALVALQALALLGYGGYVLAAALTGRTEQLRSVWDAEGVGAYLLILGTGLAVVGYGLLRARRWAYAPAALSQLISLAVVWNMHQAGAYQLAVPLLLCAGTALWLVLSRYAGRS